jgi:hypothetical protein
MMKSEQPRNQTRVNQCPYCGERLWAQDRFCPTCGSAVAQLDEGEPPDVWTPPAGGAPEPDAREEKPRRWWSRRP